MVSKKTSFKKAISLIEVIIAITLLSFIIVVLLNIKEQNIFLLSKVKNTFINNTYFSSLVFSNKEEMRNGNIYLSDVLVFRNDEDNKNLKKIKINVKDKIYKKQEISLDFFKVGINQIQSQYKTSNNKKIYYSFKIIQ